MLINFGLGIRSGVPGIGSNFYILPIFSNMAGYSGLKVGQPINYIDSNN